MAKKNMLVERARRQLLGAPTAPLSPEQIKRRRITGVEPGESTWAERASGVNPHARQIAAATEKAIRGNK